MSEQFENGLRLIKNVAFYDTPKEPHVPSDCLDPGDDDPYIPNGAEWRALEANLLRTRVAAALGVAFGAMSLIVSIGVFAVKIWG
jgi:hypothetical protein